MNEKRIQAAAVRRLIGDISDMTLWRYLNRPDMAFPRPIYIGRRRYWREVDILEWLDRQDDTAGVRRPVEIRSLDQIDTFPKEGQK